MIDQDLMNEAIEQQVEITKQGSIINKLYDSKNTENHSPYDTSLSRSSNSGSNNSNDINNKSINSVKINKIKLDTINS